MNTIRIRQPACVVRLPLLAAALLSLTVSPALLGRGAPVPAAPKKQTAPAVGFQNPPAAGWKPGRGAPRYPDHFRDRDAAGQAPRLSPNDVAAAMPPSGGQDAHPALQTAGIDIPSATPSPVPDIIISDFEFPRWRDAGWTVSGAAFGTGPSNGPIGRQRPIRNYLGKRLASSHLGAGDRPTGSVTSPAFTIRRQYINLLAGAGGWPGETCVNLIINGKPVRTATGDNISENLSWKTWDVSEFSGETAIINIMDAATGKWGHINIDQIIQSATAAAQ
jgi:hypothetical protein